MADDDKQGHLSRRTLLIGGGAGVGLLVAWAVWPRTYAPNLTAARGEHIMGAWLKIRSEEHTSELQSLMRSSYAVFCLKKKTKNYNSKLRAQHKEKKNTQYKIQERT